MPRIEEVILVDDQDNPIGIEEKQNAHVVAQRHRAFSVFLFNAKGETLIQRRALGKYHSPGLWANTCCGHPRPHENTAMAATRRLNEELGIETLLHEVTEVSYKLKLDHTMWEMEYTHVFHGFYEGNIDPNPDEACEIAWITPEDLKDDVLKNPGNYARWFRLYVLKYFTSTFTFKKIRDCA